MILEYVLLLTIFSFILFGTLMKGSAVSLANAGPLLGARIERNLVTGMGFEKNGAVEAWIKP